MRTYERTAVALQTSRGVPRGHLGRDVALFISGKTHVNGAVLVALEGADR